MEAESMVCHIADTLKASQAHITDGTKAFLGHVDICKDMQQKRNYKRTSIISDEIT